MQDQLFVLTLSIVPGGALCDDQYDYERDLLALVQAFRLETQTQASMFRLNSASGIVSLFLRGQEALTESQQNFQYCHNEITGYESGFFQKQAQGAERYTCAKEDGFIYMFRDKIGTALRIVTCRTIVRRHISCVCGNGYRGTEKCFLPARC